MNDTAEKTHSSDAAMADASIMSYVATDSSDSHRVDTELESQALRKFDLYLLPQLALLTILAYLDRTNIGWLAPHRGDSAMVRLGTNPDH